jgi:hypothetical protein
MLNKYFKWAYFTEQIKQFRLKMTGLNSKLFFGRLLSPKEVEYLKWGAAKDKIVRFTIPGFREVNEDILQLCRRVAAIEARFACESEEEVREKYERNLYYFSQENFEKAMQVINQQIFDKYNFDSKLVKINVPSELKGIELTVLKKALNKKGWLVQKIETLDEIADDLGGGKYILAPRKKEYKTKENQGIINVGIIMGSDSRPIVYNTAEIRDFYRNSQAVKKADDNNYNNAKVE